MTDETREKIAAYLAGAYMNRGDQLWQHVLAQCLCQLAEDARYDYTDLDFGEGLDLLADALGFEP